MRTGKENTQRKVKKTMIFFHFVYNHCEQRASSHRVEIQHLRFPLKIAGQSDLTFSRLIFNLLEFGVHVLKLSITPHCVSCGRKLMIIFAQALFHMLHVSY